MLTRAERLQHLRETRTCDVLIVGAGINGIGTFRDLALQGVNVVLIDRADYCSGASAASSHMVHGGVRYLENGEFRLVREAVQERGRLLKNAPHLVKPLPTTYPIFKYFSGLFNAPLQFLGLRQRPSERGAIVLKIGLALYEWFARRGRVVPRHIMRNRKKTLVQFPALNPDILFTATYYDAAMPSPERLALEVLYDGLSANPDAIALNYVSFKSGTNAEVVLQDELTGETIPLRPRVVINAAGPWIDYVNQSIGQHKRYIGGTKGTHLVLDHSALREAIGEHEIFFENKDGRIVLIYPFHDRVLIGTSDLRIDHPDEAVVTEAEIDYFFEMLQHVFPSIAVTRAEIVFTFSGVRPLPYQEEGSTGQISRDHKIETLLPSPTRPFPIFSLVGGKWTTFRAFSEQTSRTVLDWLNMPRLVETTDLAIGGGRDFPLRKEEKEKLLTHWQATYACSSVLAKTLLGRYGTKAVEILKSCQTEADKTPLQNYPTYVMGELKFLIGHEDVMHLDDLIFRRSLLAMQGLVTPAGLAELATLTAGVLGWAADRTAEEVSRVEAILLNKHRMQFNQYVSATEALPT